MCTIEAVFVRRLLYTLNRLLINKKIDTNVKRVYSVPRIDVLYGVSTLPTIPIQSSAAKLECKQL